VDSGKKEDRRERRGRESTGDREREEPRGDRSGGRNYFEDDPFEEDEYFEEGWEELGEEAESRLFRALEGLIPDILKKTVASGAAQFSEEGMMRTLLKDRGLTREAARFIVAQVTTLRREILRIISREFRFFLENIDLGGELAKILTSLSFEIRTEIRFVENDAAVRPNMRHRVKVRRNGDGEDDAREEDAEAAEDSEAREGDGDSGDGGRDTEEERPKKRRRRGLWPRGRDDDDEEEPPEEGAKKKPGGSKGASEDEEEDGR
jgi:hypothetical protein